MKRISKFEIRSRKNKQGTLMVSMYADGNKIYSAYIQEDYALSFDSITAAPILLENGMVIMALPKIGNEAKK